MEVINPADAKEVAIIGGGPAGLTAAWELAQRGHKPITFEADELVGGISRTVEYNGYRFDIGGHRFFTKVNIVNEWWMDILRDEFIVRPRLSRIYYNDKFFDYPLKPMNALVGLGPVEAVRIGLSYIKAQLFPAREEKNLEQWVSNRFGWRLYSIFFKTYTEKVWGMKCTEIGADWAAQRIKNLDLKSAVIAAFLGARGKTKGEQITTLIEEFNYPKFGPGQMWEKVQSLLEEKNFPVRMKTEVTKIHCEDGRVVAVTAKKEDGSEERVACDECISTMPIRNLLNSIEPPPPPEVVAAANKLRYRDFLTVGLVVNKAELFPDNWIYIHSEKVKVGRIQNFKNWSPHMVPDQSKSCIGLEYFVNEGDDVWSAEDPDLIELGKKETDLLGLVNYADVEDGVVIRQPKAYPVYDHEYKEALEVVRPWLDSIPNLQLVGRNGQHRYNNQDHSMVSAMYAAWNLSGEKHDVWDVNVEQEYHEEKADKVSTSGDRMVPQKVTNDPLETLRRAFARFDPVAMGAAFGVIGGIGLFLATAVLLMRGGDEVGPHLGALEHFVPLFSISWVGALGGAAVMAGFTFILGWVLAQVLNAVIAWHELRLIGRLEAGGTMDRISFEQ